VYKSFKKTNQGFSFSYQLVKLHYSLANFCIRNFANLMGIKYHSDKKYKKILIFRKAGLGDSFTSLPVIEAYQAKYPNAKFYILTLQNSRWQPQLSSVLNWNTEKVIFYKNWDIDTISKQLKEYNFDLFIELSNYRSSLKFELSSILLAYKSGITDGFGWSFSSSLFLKKWQGKSLSFDYDTYRLLKIHHFAPFTDYEEITSNFSKTKNVLFILSAGRDMNRWPIENWLQLANDIKQLGCKISILIGVKEKDYYDLASFYKLNIKVISANSLQESELIIRNSNFIVCHDTGIIHSKAAQEINTIIIFSARAYLGMWHNSTRHQHIALQNDQVDCAYCFRESCPYANKCIKLITPNQVYLSFQSMMGKG